MTGGPAVVDLDDFADEGESEGFHPDADSLTIDQAVARFLVTRINPHTREAYGRRLRQTFAAMGILYLGQLTEALYLTFAGAGEPELFIARGAARAQEKAALRAFCRWAAIEGIDDLDPVLEERVSGEAALTRPEEPDERALARAASPMGLGLAQRNEVVAALIGAGVCRHLDRLRTSDLLVDVAGDCWLAADLPAPRRHRSGRAELCRGRLLVRLSPEIHHLAVSSHRLLSGDREVDALFLGSRGEPVSAAALFSAVRKRGLEVQVMLLSRASVSLPRPILRGGFVEVVKQRIAERGVSARV